MLLTLELGVWLPGFLHSIGDLRVLMTHTAPPSGFQTKGDITHRELKITGTVFLPRRLTGRLGWHPRPKDASSLSPGWKSCLGHRGSSRGTHMQDSGQRGGEVTCEQAHVLSKVGVRPSLHFPKEA